MKTLVPGWKKGVKKFAQKASFDDLLDWRLEVKEFPNSDPVDFAARNDKPRMMQLFLYTDLDINRRRFYYDEHHGPAFNAACSHGSVEVAKMMINSSKEFGIDLKARDSYCFTALDEINYKIRRGDPRKREIYNELKTMLEEEYSKMDQS